MIDPSKPDFSDTPVSAERPRYGYAPADATSPPCVTILTPFYNAGHGFEDTARSVLQQSFQQWEWLIVNDCSTEDFSLQVLDRYRDLDPRVRVIDCPQNGGPSRARNIGYQAARTEYIAQIDADDLLEPTAVEKWFWFLCTHPDVGFVKGYAVGFGAEQYLWTRGFHSNERFLRENPVQPNGMVRRRVHQAAGGYDEHNREGLEDWDFWLRCATAGHWGTTIPEYLDWYRRRASHNDRWDNWDSGARQNEFHKTLKARYPHLWASGFPRIRERTGSPFETIAVDLPCENLLDKHSPRVLLLVPWMTMGGSDKFNLDLLEQLTRRGYQVTVATTLRGEHPWHHEFGRFTPDLFIADHIVPPADVPRFLLYLIRSRRIDVVLVAHSELGYQLLPWLRSRCAGVAFVDYCHIEEASWKNGGYPRFSVGYQELLDLTVVSSAHLRRWLVDRGAEAARIEVCYTGVDPAVWRPDPAARAAVRRELGFGDGDVVILFAGRLCDQKQPLVFARTLGALRERGLDFRAIVAGDGDDRPRLEQLLAGSGLGDRVRMLGAVPTGTVKRLMPAADIFFLPSRWEGIALSLYEAMACGTAFVGADVGGQRELLPDGCGHLIEQGGEDAQVARYADVLAGLLTDPARRRALGERARQRVEQGFTLDAMGARMVELFDRARELARAEPRPAVGPGLGRESATLAIEHVRVTVLADGLWRDREEVRFMRHLAAPIFRWGASKDWWWLRPIKRAIRRRLGDRG